MSSSSQSTLRFPSVSERAVADVRGLQVSNLLFAIGLIGLGVVALVYGDFAMGWQPVAPWFPARTALAYASGVLMLVCGAGLLFRTTVMWAVRILFPFLIVWALLKAPALIVAPQIEGVWLGFGELAMLLAGGWILFARLGVVDERSPLAFAAGDRGVRIAQILFGLWLIPVGLSHFIYVKETFDLVPAWIPMRAEWGYVTGAGHIAAGLAVLFRVVPRLAAWCEAVMLAVITILVWVPAVATQPHLRLNWTALFISWIIGAAAFAVAQDLERVHRAHTAE